MWIFEDIRAEILILCVCWFNRVDSCCDGLSSTCAALSGDGSWSFFVFLWSLGDIRVGILCACCSDEVPSCPDLVSSECAALYKILFNIFVCRRNRYCILGLSLNAAKDPSVWLVESP